MSDTNLKNEDEFDETPLLSNNDFDLDLEEDAPTLSSDDDSEFSEEFEDFEETSTPLLSNEAEVSYDDEDFAEDGENLTIVQIDPQTGQQVEAVVDLAMPPLNADEAKELTERIRTQTNVLYLLIKRAHAGKAYVALGYSTFEEYVKEEFDYSRGHAYRLLDQANVIEAIETRAPSGTKIHVGSGVASSLRKVLPEVLYEVEEQLEGIEDPETAGTIIQEVLQNQRDRQIEAEKEEAVKEYDGPYTGDYDGYGSDDDEDEDEDAGSTSTSSNALLDDPEGAKIRFENLYSLYSALKSLSEIAEKGGGDLVDLIPANRREEFSSLLESVIPFLGEFNDSWKEYLETIEDELETDSGDHY